MLRLATGLEGHPDNVAACLAGGLTIAWTSARGAEAARLEPLDGLTPVLCVPADPMLTQTARGLAARGELTLAQEQAAMAAQGARARSTRRV